MLTEDFKERGTGSWDGGGTVHGRERCGGERRGAGAGGGGGGGGHLCSLLLGESRWGSGKAVDARWCSPEGGNASLEERTAARFQRAEIERTHERANEED